MAENPYLPAGYAEKLEAHSSLVGGSSAERRINCPGSYQLEQKLPPAADKSSVYADEGTALHECMAYILTGSITDLDQVLGMTFGVSETSPAGYVMTHELIDEAITPCVDFFDALVDELTESDGDFEFVIETRVQMPGIPSSFGTSDLIFKTPKRSGIVDWKFGVGVAVKASYEESYTKVEDVAGPTTYSSMKPNAQLMYYARAAMHTLPHLFADSGDWPVDLYIVQPRSRDLVDSDDKSSYCQTTVRELETFRMQLTRAIAEATGDNPSLQLGPWCKFAKCKSICPKHTGPMLDLSAARDALQDRRKGSVAAIGIDWSQQFDTLLTLADIAEQVIGEIRAQAHAYLDEGNQIEGWKLVDKRPTASYTDEKGAARHAIGLGLPEAMVFEAPAVRSPAQLRDALVAAKKVEGATAAARKEAAKEALAPFVKNVSSGTTLARADDTRKDAVVTSTMLNAIGAKLAALTSG